METWHKTMIENLVAALAPNDDVLGLLLFGSGAQLDSQSDAWSDLDLLLVVQNGKLDRFFPTTEWLTPFGNLYTFSQSSNAFACTTRVCFEDFRRIDVVITSEENLANVGSWPGVAFASARKILFSRSRVLDHIARRDEFPQKFTPATEENFGELVRNFRFKSMQAVYKVVRGDLLIALHLAQDLLRDCCVLGMMLRDRATGTTIHKHGGTGNHLVAELEGAQRPFTPAGILESIQVSNELFERLCRDWSGEYQENHLITNWIERAKTRVGGQ